MNILYLYQYFKFPDERGGSRAYDLATSFAQKGYQVTVLAATSNEKYKTSERWHLEEREGLKVHRIFLQYQNDMTYSRRIWMFLKFLWFASFRLLKLKGDVVLATSTPLTIGVPALIKKWFGKTPFIFEVRDVWPEAVIAIGAIKNKPLQKILYGFEKLVYKNASAVVPLSVDMKASIDTRYPQFKNKTKTVIPNISELNRFQQDHLNVTIIEETIGFKPRFSVLYAGTFGKVNGIHKVIELAQHTLSMDPQLVYILIGRGAKKQEVINQAKRTEVLNKNVFILDPIPKAELPDWYASASMGSSFVINVKELWANSANKFFDTLAAGRPVLINYGGWQAEAIKEKNTGYILPCEITEKAAAKFIGYTENETLYKHQKVNALALAKEKYSLAIASANYEKIFNKIRNSE